MQLSKKTRSPGSKVDHRHAARSNTFDQRAGIGSGVANIVVRPQSPHPTIEDLNSPRPRRNLTDGKRRQNVYDFSHEPPPEGLIGIHELLRAYEVARGATFDHVARHSKGRAHEADYGNAAAEGARYLLN